MHWNKLKLAYKILLLKNTITVLKNHSVKYKKKGKLKSDKARIS